MSLPDIFSEVYSLSEVKSNEFQEIRVSLTLEKGVIRVRGTERNCDPSCPG